MALELALELALESESDWGSALESELALALEWELELALEWESALALALALAQESRIPAAYPMEAASAQVRAGKGAAAGVQAPAEGILPGRPDYQAFRHHWCRSPSAASYPLAEGSPGISATNRNRRLTR
jgi:hypothetical protein